MDVLTIHQKDAILAKNNYMAVKGYGGFWWGFFLGVIGIIIVAVRPDE